MTGWFNLGDSTSVCVTLALSSEDVGELSTCVCRGQVSTLGEKHWSHDCVFYPRECLRSLWENSSDRKKGFHLSLVGILKRTRHGWPLEALSLSGKATLAFMPSPTQKAYLQKGWPLTGKRTSTQREQGKGFWRCLVPSGRAASSCLIKVLEVYSLKGILNGQGCRRGASKTPKRLWSRVHKP